MKSIKDNMNLIKITKTSNYPIIFMHDYTECYYRIFFLEHIILEIYETYLETCVCELKKKKYI